MIDAIRLELRAALRDIVARPAWAALLVAVLSAGLACVLYVVVLLDGLVLRPLPFERPQQLYMAGIADGDDLDSVPQADAWAIARRLGDAARLATWSDGTINLVDGARAERFDGSFVSPNLFALLGVAPALGGGFDAADSAPGAPLRVAIAHDVWRTRFDADPAVIGRAVRVNGEPATIVAVMPPRFAFPRIASVWIPDRLSATPQRSDDRPVQLVLRVPAVDALPRVREAIAGWLAQAATEDPNAFRGDRPLVQPAREYFVDAQTRAVVGVMLGAALLVLLVACGNAANLLLARQLGRRQELAVRSALGASRGRIVGGLLTQALLLALLAAAIALLLAHGAVAWTVASFASAGEEGAPRWIEFSIGPTTALAALAAALATAGLSALLPALGLSAGPISGLREGGRAVAGGAMARAGGLLVSVEVALSAALLVGALAMVQLVRALDDFDLGVRTENVLTARLGLFDSQYPDAPARLRLFDRLLERVRAEPGVLDATLSTALPGLMGPNEDVLPAEAAPGETPWEVGFATADPRFGGTYGTRLLQGRWFDAGDRAGATPVALVDRKFVARHLGAGDPLGRRLRISPGESGDRVVTVVGVLEDLSLDDADGPAEGVLLVPQAQETPAFASLAVRLAGDPAMFKTRLVELMREVDPDTPLYWVRTYDEVLAAANFGQRLLARIYGALGLVALLLAAGGLYGVVGASVAQRTREIGVRRALGARPGVVLRGVLARSARQTGLGLAAGLILGVPFAQAMARSMDGALALDPMIWLLVAVLLSLVAIGAAAIPARRALGVDPMVALRHD